MKGFITVHDRYNHSELLISVASIISVSDCYIITTATVNNVEESYREILALMEDAAHE